MHYIYHEKTPNLVAKIFATKFDFVPDCLYDCPTTSEEGSCLWVNVSFTWSHMKWSYQQIKAYILHTYINPYQDLWDCNQINRQKANTPN